MVKGGGSPSVLSIKEQNGYAANVSKIAAYQQTLL
jgi:hypothetical protein